MSAIDSVHRQIRQAWYELKTFDWLQVLQPSGVGHWPALPRLVVLLFCALAALSLVFVVSVLTPRTGAEDLAHLTAMEENIRIRQDQNSVIAARLLELRRQSFVSYAWLQHESAARADITQMMDVVRAAASVNGVHLLSVAPEIFPEKEQVLLRVSARVTLPSLSMFWLFLAETDSSFTINAFGLELTEKQDVFELNVDLLVPAASGIKPASIPSQRDRSALVGAHSGDTEMSGLCTTELCSKQRRLKRAEPKGFLLRTGDSPFLYLIRDEKGHLKSVEE
ncbi:MAG: hypothetical protein Q7W55_04375 [Pseudohongiella sp.]|nr:hypothetical protein [Pseudohongiella sp.]MDO9521928.1 hypothetical protein [Pseudohongiella sp.]MDP2128563.1 hypothetical protein [Pseudohongiella sp.]